MGSALARAARWLGRGTLYWLRHWPVRKIVILGCACLVLLGGAAAGTGYVMLKHFNANLVQDDISGLLGAQPVNTHPQAENIVVIGSDTRKSQGSGYGTGLVTAAPVKIPARTATQNICVS